MAETSLFGATPESIQRERNAALQQEALQYAKLDPFQRATAGIYAGSQRLGGAIGGLLGGVDPEIQRATQRQELSKGLMVDDPSSYMQAAQKAAQMGDYGAARELSAQAQAMQMKRAQLGSEQALAAQRLREKAGADPIQQLLRSGKFSTVNVAEYERTGNIADLGEPIEKLSPPEIKKLQDYRDTLPVGSTARQEVDAVIKAEGRGKGTTVTTVVGQAPKIAESVDAFDKTVAPYRSTYDTAGTARSLLNEASASNNSQAFEAARTTLAKTIGENKLSNEDIRRTGIDPRLVAGALDWVNKKIEGVPNQDIIKQMYAVSTALQQKAAQQINEKADRAQSVAKASDFKGDLQTFFPKIPVPGAADQDKEARYQAWKKAQQTPKGF